MTKKYTPGPWEVYDPKNNQYNYGIDGANGIAVVWFGKDIGEGIENVADARLISCAPELLEALEAIYNHPNTRYEVEAQIGGEVWDIIKKANGQ